MVDDMLGWIHYSLQHPDFYTFPFKDLDFISASNPDSVNLKYKKF